jgi:hypothetical protein
MFSKSATRVPQVRELIVKWRLGRPTFHHVLAHAVAQSPATLRSLPASLKQLVLPPKHHSFNTRRQFATDFPCFLCPSVALFTVMPVVPSIRQLHQLLTIVAPTAAKPCDIFYTWTVSAVMLSSHVLLLSVVTPTTRVEVFAANNHA